LEPSAAGHDALGSTAEAGEEVRLDEASNDAEIGLDEVAIDQGGGAVAGGAELNQGVEVFGFMIEDAVAIDDGRGQELTEFGVGVGSVGAELVEQGDPVAGMRGEMIEQPGDDPVVGRGAGEIGESDADPVGGLDEFEQRRAADRVVQSIEDGLPFIRETGLMRGGDDRGAVVREFDRELTLAVSEHDVHGDAG
jgi:hypothetical protein